MRKLARAVMLCALLLGLPACVVVLGVRDRPDCKKVVEMDGEWYVVDAEHRRLRKIRVEGRIEDRNVPDEAVSED